MEAKGQHGVGKAIKESILHVEKDGLAVGIISARLMKVRLNLEGKSNNAVVQSLFYWF